MIEIRKGRTNALGRYITQGWTIFEDGKMATLCTNLAQAKHLAFLHGASGKWRREVRQNGRRQIVVYVEVKE